MIRWIFSVAVLLATCSAVSAKEGKDDDEGPSVDEQFARLVNLGPGVHNIQKDKKGRITSCIVIGQGRISTVLGKGKGMEVARQKANLAASAEFVKWLKEEVSVFSSNDDETVVLMEGTEGANEDTLKEAGKSVEKSSSKMESISKGLVRGLVLIHKDVNGDDKVYTIVKGWKADTADGAKKLSADLASDEPESGKNGSRKNSAGSSKGDKEIESSSATSDDAADFLPKKK